jgi:hypothetical protein
MDLQHVTTIQQRDDNTLVVYIQTDGFNPGQEVEVSIYLTQGNAYATFNDKKRIPLPDLNNPKQLPPLPVELPATELEVDQDVTVVTRITDVWPTVLQPDSKMVGKIKGVMGEYKGVKEEYIDQAPKAVWTYHDPAGKGPGDLGSPSSSD